jgi:hypothetical protein
MHEMNEQRNIILSAGSRLQHAVEARDLLMWLEVSLSLHDIKA